MNHEYAAINGVPEFNKVAKELALGKDSPVIKENRVGGCFAVALKFHAMNFQFFYRPLRFKLSLELVVSELVLTSCSVGLMFQKR